MIYGGDFQKYKPGKWVCHLFGHDGLSGGMTWTPSEGYEPNWFWRLMQYLILGNKWVKK